MNLVSVIYLLVYPYESEEQTSQNVVAERCFRGKSIIKSNGLESN